jgi:hypothetical protein
MTRYISPITTRVHLDATALRAKSAGCRLRLSQYPSISVRTMQRWRQCPCCWKWPQAACWRLHDGQGQARCQDSDGSTSALLPVSSRNRRTGPVPDRPSMKRLRPMAIMLLWVSAWDESYSPSTAYQSPMALCDMSHNAIMGSELASVKSLRTSVLQIEQSAPSTILFPGAVLNALDRH